MPFHKCEICLNFLVVLLVFRPLFVVVFNLVLLLYDIPLDDYVIMDLFIFLYINLCHYEHYSFNLSYIGDCCTGCPGDLSAIHLGRKRVTLQGCHQLHNVSLNIVPNCFLMWLYLVTTQKVPNVHILHNILCCVRLLILCSLLHLTDAPGSFKKRFPAVTSLIRFVYGWNHSYVFLGRICSLFHVGCM